jgi:hypothetical protein
MSKFQARQGDLFFKSISKIPAKGLKKKTDPVLAYGEVTFHSHKITSSFQDCESYVDEEGDIYVRSDKDITIGHDEHNNIILPANEWICVSRQVEYNALEKSRQRVAD